ncbi:MAG: MmcQ/YjbR family DNA-binding protein [Erysipelotrichaceae bacterium]|nr:MmcQ/YjbR family DNA-binding protein [Erysipelotrichaceae bacterium]
MNVIEEIFKRSHSSKTKLKNYGFILDNRDYIFRKRFMNDEFELIMTVKPDGKIEVKVMESELNEEYPNVYTDAIYGSFVSKVREEMIEILNDIRSKCFEDDLFIYPQTKRIVSYIRKQYGDKPEFLWEKYPDYAVFRNRNTGKWYAIIMNLDGKKLGLKEGEIEIIDLKADEALINALKSNKGYHEAYHMNKDKWLTIILDESNQDEVIFSLIDYSYQQMEQSDEWIFPANPKYYDMENCFARSNTLNWKQSGKVRVGDIVYLYVGAPISAILYKCLVEETDIPYEYKDKNLSINKLMRLSLLKRYKKDKYTYAYLNSLGINFLRGPRRISKAVSEKLK